MFTDKERNDLFEKLEEMMRDSTDQVYARFHEPLPTNPTIKDVATWMGQRIEASRSTRNPAHFQVNIQYIAAMDIDPKDGEPEVHVITRVYTADPWGGVNDISAALAYLSGYSDEYQEDADIRVVVTESDVMESESAKNALDVVNETVRSMVERVLCGIYENDKEEDIISRLIFTRVQ